MPRRPKSSAARRSSAERLFASHKQYDPAVEGLGNELEWQRAFNMAMGFEEAQEFRDSQRRKGKWGSSEYSIIGELAGVDINENSMWSEIKTAFRKASMNCHPDRTSQHGIPHGQAEEHFKEVSAAYAIISHMRGEN